MKTVVAYVATLASLLVGCGETEQCVDQSSAHYNNGLVRLLTAKGVTNSVQKGRGVCFAKRDEAKVKATVQELERYSFSKEEVVANRRKLSSEAPRSVTCSAKGDRTHVDPR